MKRCSQSSKTLQRVFAVLQRNMNKIPRLHYRREWKHDGGGDWHQSKARKENETQRQRTERNAKQRAGGASAKSLFFPDLNVLSTHCAIVAINDSRSLFIFNLAGSYVPKRTLTCTSAEMQHQHSLWISNCAERKGKSRRWR